MNIQTLLSQAQLLIDNESYDKAYEMLKSAYDIDKTDKELLEKIAVLAQTMEKTEEAIIYFEKLLEIDPASILAHSELMDYYHNIDKYKYYLTRGKYKAIQGNISQAVSDYKKAIDATTDENDIMAARFLLGKSYEFLGKTNNAIDEYYRIIEHENNLVIFMKLAELYQQNDDKEAAIHILKRALEAYPDEKNIKENIAGLCIMTNQLETALEYVQTEITKAKIFLMLERNDEAFEILQDYKDKNDSQYLALMAEYYFNNKDFENCEEMIKAYKKNEPQNPLSYQMLALVEEERANMGLSHFYWGKYYLLKQDPEMAFNEFLTAHNINPEEQTIINEIINLLENKGDKGGAIEFYEKILRADPKNINALTKLGNFYSDMYEFSNALSYYEKVEEINPNRTDVYKKIGFCYEKMKNNILAKEYYEKYLAKAPLTPEVEELKKRLAGMSDEVEQEDIGLLEKLMGMFSRK